MAEVELVACQPGWLLVYEYVIDVHLVCGGCVIVYMMAYGYRDAGGRELLEIVCVT